MRDICFVWKGEDGGPLRVTYPVWKAQKPGETDDAFLERVAAKLTNPLPLPASSIPTDRANRRFWKIRDGKVVVDPPIERNPKVPE